MSQQNSSLNGPQTREAYDQMMGLLRVKGDIFIKAAEDNLAREKASIITDVANHWLQTKEAGEALNKWVGDIISFLDYEMPGNGPVGHDRRHLAKDIAAGIHRLVDDNAVGFETLSLIPSFIHDTGRLVEARYLDVVPFSETSRDHAHFSFGIASQFACKPYFKIIPKEIIDQILYAILVHSGKEAEVRTPMAHAVRSADREQLIGPEGIARLLSVQTGTQDFSILHTNPVTRPYMPKDGADAEWDALHSPEAYLRNLYHQHGRLGEKRAEMLKTISAAFLLMATRRDIQKQIFAPEFARDKRQKRMDGDKKLISSKIWKRAQAIMAYGVSGTVSADVEKAIAFVFGAPGTSANPIAIERFRKHFAELPSRNQRDLTRAFRYAASKRQELDDIDLDLLRRVKKRPDFTGKIAAWSYNILSATNG